MSYQRGAPHASIRLLRIARRMFEGGIISTQWVRQEYGVSSATAKRDLQLVGMYLPVEISVVGQAKQLRIVR
jgi:predicted DNA-binding transcriptional regulator YafY